MKTSSLTRLSKLRAMSPAELIERVRYRAVLEAERRRHRRGALAPPSRLRDALVGSLRGHDWRAKLIASRTSHRTRFLPGVTDQAAMRGLFGSRYAGELSDTMRWAEEARQHRFEFFGERFEYGDDIPWQADPVTRREWPALFHADVPVHRGNVGQGDVKHVWELSRQQYLIDLGKAWFLAGSRPHLDAVRRLVRGWIAGNPYATGVNWSCALEPAFRSFSWLWAYFLTVDGLDDEFHLEWLTGFCDHARFIECHLEHYSSPYNHLIGEASALYLLGTSFPEFADAGRWRRSARAVLEGRLAEQFYADGGSVEQSTFYHHATVGYLLLAALAGRAVGDELPPPIWRAIERGLEFSLALMQPDGRTPEIGGADDGKPIRMEQLPFWDFRPYLAIGAVLFRRGDFKTAAGRFHEDALWLLGPDGLEAFERLEAGPPGAASVALEASGYHVLRSDWSPAADYLCFDCGEQAAGMRTDAVPNSMHGHADCLSVIAWLGGRRILVDSGFYAYNCGGEWEAHFRETAAHNTARVDGRDQATHLGKMAWSHSYRASREGWSSDADLGWVAGSHDGYARGDTGVTHRRVAWLRDGHYIVLVDEFTGAGVHDLEVNFQFAPGDLEKLGTGGALYSSFAELLWVGSDVWEADVRCGGQGPADGWIAPSLGVRRPAPRLTLRSRMTTSPSVLLAIIAASDAGGSRTSVVAVAGADAAGRLVAVRGAGWVDYVASAAISAGTAVHTDALAAICRVHADRVECSCAGRGQVTADEAALRRLARRPQGEGRP